MTSGLGPDDFRVINGALAGVAFVALTRQFYWQYLAGVFRKPIDVQELAAAYFVISLSILIGQIAATLTSLLPALSDNPRGILTWVNFCLSCIVWNQATERYNMRILHKRYLPTLIPLGIAFALVVLILVLRRL